MASTTSSTGADNGSATTRSNTTTPCHSHTSTACLNKLSQQDFSFQHVNAALANTSRHQLRTEKSAEEASVAASTARMTAMLQDFDLIMRG